MQQQLTKSSPTFTNLLTENLIEGQEAFADTLKLLVYQKDSELIDAINFENDRAFLDPILFAYFNEKNPTISLRQILFGYIEDDKKFSKIEVVTDEKGIIYLPEIGYLKTTVYSKKLSLLWNKHSKSIRLTLGQTDIPYELETILKLKEIDIEIWKHPLPIAKDYIRKWDFENQREKEIPAEVEITNTIKKHLLHLENAFAILKKTSPSQYDQYKTCVRRIAIYTNHNTASFAVRSVHGNSFFTMDIANEDDEVFFLEELSHQCAHNALNAIMHDMSVYFKVDAEHEPLKDYNGEELERRTISSAFHGLYTVAARLEVFLQIVENDIIQGKQKHEFAGRFVDLKGRYLIGLEKMDHERVFTTEGFQLYKTLDEFCAKGFKKIDSYVQQFDLSNQPNTFSYPAFIKLNPIENFKDII